MKQTNNGALKTFLQLLNSCNKFVIPKIQRDHAQGRIDPEDSSLYEEVRADFVASLKDALVKNTPLVLDYVYGSTDAAGFFYPIDGQQRLTTIFLLHWYVAVKEKKLDNVKEVLSKFTYEIRDTAKEFCISLLDISFDVDKVTSIAAEIRDSAKYYIAYNEDPTVQAMLVMLEAIHTALKDQPDLFGKLGNIKFWVLSLEDFGLTDDLFVKMNARGKRLSRFDTFKSELEASLGRRIKAGDDSLIPIVDQWKQNIDNAYLDTVWPHGGKDFAERNIYRTIMLYVNCMIAANGGTTNDLWEANDKNAPYRVVVNEITAKPTLLRDICNILSKYNHWKNTDPNINELLLESNNAKTFVHYVKVRLFGILYWWATIDTAKAELYFDDFYRILSNYVASNREYAIRPRQYQSSIDATNVSAKLRFVKDLVDGFQTATCDFHSYIKATTSTELSYEREKLNYPALDEIIALEHCPALRRSIHNFFFNKNVYIAAPEINEITQSETLSNLALRIILSYSGGLAGIFRTLTFDDTTQQSGRKKLYYESADDLVFVFCHRLFLNTDNVFGDKVMTVEGKSTAHLQDLEEAVKKFAQAFHEKYYGQGKTVADVLQQILESRLLQASFNDPENVLWYIVKYPSAFFCKPSSTAFHVARRKHYDGTPDEDNVYDMLCTLEFFSSSEPHHNPFYLATQQKLDALHSGITITSTLRNTGIEIEFKNPCMLSNGWQIHILKEGRWRITFHGNAPDTAIIKKYNITGDEYELDNPGEDCIELICRFIMECN